MVSLTLSEMLKYKSFIISSFYTIFWITFSSSLFAQDRIDPLLPPDNSLIKQENLWIIDILSYIESFLLKVALPLVTIGAFLYVAFELLTAEGNEEKMKKAWKVVTYSAIGLITIALAYAIIAMASRLSF